MLMRIGRAAAGSRLIGLVGGDVMLTDTAGLTDACILSPRNRDPTGQNRPRYDIDNQNQAKQNEAGGPRLAVPIFIRRYGIGKNHHWERSGRLLPAWTPKTIPKSGKQQRRGLACDARERQQHGGEDSAIRRRHDDGG